MPVILVGDFNSDPNYKNSAIQKFLREKRIGRTEIEQSTYPTDYANERLDYIFFTAKNFELVESKYLRIMEKFQITCRA